MVDTEQRVTSHAHALGRDVRAVRAYFDRPAEELSASSAFCKSVCTFPTG